MFRIFVLGVVGLLMSGCDSAYYGTWEKLGWHKRDLLADAVEETRDAQTEAKEQFATALDQFRSVVQFEGGELEEKYDKLNAELESSEAAAADVRERIAQVESVAGALFEEWEQELDAYEDASLRQASARQLSQTQSRYQEMVSLMHRAESKMEPVLKVFRDQVLFLKHNLNARAIASLQDTAAELGREVDILLRDMEASIQEANEFLSQMETE